MSQLVGSDSQPENREELDGFLHRLGSERFQEQGWQEPYDSRDSRTVLWGLEVKLLRPTRRCIFSYLLNIADIFFKTLLQISSSPKHLRIFSAQPITKTFLQVVSCEMFFS
jgi:hypothetical protein